MYVSTKMFQMCSDYAAQLDQIEALTMVTSSKTARSFKDAECVLNNSYVKLDTASNISIFNFHYLIISFYLDAWMIARSIIMKTGVPSSSKTVGKSFSILFYF